MTTILKAEDLRKTYVLRRNTLEVLRGASLDVERGSTVSITGLSGAGKSTLLHILGGLDRPDAGRVWLDGEDLYAARPARRTGLRATKIGFVFQAYHLMQELDVLENVMLPSMIRRRMFGSGRALRGKAIELLAAVGLAERADHTPVELSGGEQQRVALARALMNDPSIVFADEPTGNLDDATGGHVLRQLFAMMRERGHTLVMVTHNVKVSQLCDRQFRIEAGQIVPDTGAQASQA